MNTNETLQQFKETVNHYLQELNNFTLEELKHQPNENEWSLGQMYLHLINSALYMQLRNIDDCMSTTAVTPVPTEGKSKDAIAVFELGSFPPIRIQVPPSPEYTPQQPESREQLIQGLKHVVSRMEEIEPRLAEAPLQNTVAHPRFGPLNALEWFKLTEMHYRHHLLQLERLKAISRA
ncbi:hypothetical protein BVG16_21720 [Paenibacillus selenitireducens]|uniref:DinB-like domain-containing protein n=1 Tax=Paenibacillus selenitireducens TaxID=1324314 RepID=A0A1T2X5P4_9BACL|nr:DinB family protein [Paenibacillus selenitireducens]OPA75221.1 hypothetical protein BVG16_21720 [Paenibacillus selenitireducens]